MVHGIFYQASLRLCLWTKLHPNASRIIAVYVSLYACSGETAQHSTAQHSTAQHSTAQHGTARQGRAGQGRAGQGRAGQGRAGQGRAGQGRAGQVQSCNGSTGSQTDSIMLSQVTAYLNRLQLLGWAWAFEAL